jgi:hypothetical protein
VLVVAPQQAAGPPREEALPKGGQQLTVQQALVRASVLAALSVQNSGGQAQVVDRRCLLLPWQHCQLDSHPPLPADHEQQRPGLAGAWLLVLGVWCRDHPAATGHQLVMPAVLVVKVVSCTPQEAAQLVAEVLLLAAQALPSHLLVVT